MGLRQRAGLDPRTLLFASLCLVGVALAVAVGWRPAAHWGNVDATVFVTRSQLVARGHAPVFYQDPPFRYVPLAAIYALLPPLSPSLASRVGSLHAAVVAFVVLPASTYLLASVVFDRWAGLGAMVGALCMHAYPPVYDGFYSGQWQDLLVLPICYAGLAMLYRHGVVRDERAWKTVGVVGALLALAALTQLMAAYFLGCVVLVTLLAWEDVRGLVGVIWIATLGAVPLVALPKLVPYLLIWFEGKILPAETLAVARSGGDALAILASPFSLGHALAQHRPPIVVQTITSLSVLVVLSRRAMPTGEAALLFESTFLFGLATYLLWKLSRFGYVGDRVEVFFAPLAGSMLVAWIVYYMITDPG